jgi:chorismate synthase
MKGSEHNDLFNANGSTRTNLQEAYKAELAMVWIFISELLLSPATIMQKQESLDNTGAITEMTGKGRHDPCVVPRAVPIVEAMAAIVLAFYLINKTYL